MSLAKIFLAAVLYAAVASGANPVFAGGRYYVGPAGADAGFAAGLDRRQLSGLRRGEMRKLAIPKLPQKISALAFENLYGDPMRLTEYHGKIVLVNFWATWCAPCRAEMPSLDALQRDLGGDDFAVVPIATGRNPKPAMKRFFAEAGITDLPLLRDPRRALSRDMDVLGLPVTVILNRDGKEIARMTGDADWHSDDALLFLRAVIGEENGYQDDG